MKTPSHFKKLLWVIGLFCFASSTAMADDCPSKTREQWLDFFKEESQKLANSNNYYNKELAEYYKDCRPTWMVMGLNKCSERITIAAEARWKTRTKGGSMGWEMSDKDYVFNIPEKFRSLPSELKDGLPDNIREIAKQKGWKVFKYRSRTVPNPPSSSYNRVLVVVPGPQDDKYIQFTISDDVNNPDKPERLIDFISVEHNKNDPNKKAQIHFTQFWRDSNGRNPKDKIHTGQGYDSCYSCHPNGVRELSPEPGSYTKEDAETLKELKKMMSSYGQVEFNGALHREAWGAPMGKKQGCTKCHNNYEGKHLQSRGAINTRTSNMHIRHKMTQDFSMPVTSLDTEKKLYDFIDSIPYVLTEEEREAFHRKMRGQSQNRKFNFAIDEMHRLGKIDDKKKAELKLILDGNPDYPNCLGKPDCYMGIKKQYASLQANLTTQNEQYKRDTEAYYFEKCKEENLVSSSEESIEVNSTSRGGAVWYNPFSWFGGDDDDSEGADQ